MLQYAVLSIFLCLGVILNLSFVFNVLFVHIEGFCSLNVPEQPKKCVLYSESGTLMDF